MTCTFLTTPPVKRQRQGLKKYNNAANVRIRNGRFLRTYVLKLETFVLPKEKNGILTKIVGLPVRTPTDVTCYMKKWTSVNIVFTKSRRSFWMILFLIEFWTAAELFACDSISAPYCRRE